MTQPAFTLGIEEEFQVIDPETRALRSHISQMFAAGEEKMPHQIQRELHQSVIEIGSKVCQNIRDVREILQSADRRSRPKYPCGSS